MPKIFIFFLVLMSSPLFAQTDVHEDPELGERVESEGIQAGSYQLENPKELEINGEKFLSYDLATLRPHRPTTHRPAAVDCFNQNTAPLNLNLEKSMFAANLAATALAGYGVYKSKNDKLQHVFAGFVISTTVSGAMQLMLPKDMKHRKLVSSLIGFGAAVLIGTAKEVRDRQGFGHPSAADAFATYAGGAVGSVSISFTDLGSLFKKR